jgi:hypothetical protein
MRAGGIIGHASAYHRSIGARWVGTDLRAERGEALVQIIKDDARLARDTLAIIIHADDPVHIPGHVKDNARAQRFPGQAAPGAARRHRDSFGRRIANNGRHVTDVPRRDNTLGHDPVYAGIGTVSHPAQQVGKNIPPHNPG